MPLFAVKNVVDNKECIALGAHLLGWALVVFATKKSLSLKPETTLISLLASTS
jgi:hypothetical protein